MNTREARVLAITSGINPNDYQALRQAIQSDLLLITQGAAGFDIITEAGPTFHSTPRVLNPRHTNGAGDAATAALTHALVTGATIPKTIHAFTADTLTKNG